MKTTNPPRIGPPALLGGAFTIVPIITSLIPEIPFEVRLGLAIVLGLLALILFGAALRAFWWSEGFEAGAGVDSSKDSLRSLNAPAAGQHAALPAAMAGVAPGRAPQTVLRRVIRPKLTIGDDDLADVVYSTYICRRRTPGDHQRQHAACILKFRLGEGTQTGVTARMRYQFEGRAKSIDAGCWLGEPNNTGGFSIGETGELVLALIDENLNKYVLDDHRKSAGDTGLEALVLLDGTYNVRIELDKVYQDENYEEEICTQVVTLRLIVVQQSVTVHDVLMVEN